MTAPAVAAADYAEKSHASQDPRRDNPHDPRRPQEGGEYAIDDRQLLSIVQTEIDGSLGWTGTRLAEARRANLNEYFGNPRGDEIEGRSQVVSRVTFEQVEWMVDPVVDPFVSGPQVVRFTGRGKRDPEESKQDDARAKQATDACNYVWHTAGGHKFLKTAVKDGGIQKNGIGKVWYDQAPSEGFLEAYEGKTFDEVALLLDNPNLELKRATAWMPVDPADPYGERSEMDMREVPEEQLDLFLYDLEMLRVNRTGQVRLENIPPEEFIINRDARDLYGDTCRFVGHRIRATESDLVRWGFDREMVERLPGSQSIYTTDQDAIVRASQDDSFPLVYSYRSDSERVIYVTECYILVDRDDDGVSEWWKVVVAGEYGQALLLAEPCDGHPFVSFTPIPIPHRFYGYAIADVVADIQHMDTTLQRLYFDCLYLGVDPMNVVYSQGDPEGGDEASVPMVNLDQLINRIPGGYVEEYERNALRPYEQKSNAAEMLPGFDYLEKIKTRRTGISPEAMGVDPNAISTHVYGAMVQQSGAQRRIIGIAREAATQFVVEAFKKIYKCLLQNHTQPMMMKLRGEWVAADPSSWEEGYSCEIAVGLGHGSRMERAADAEAIMQMQKALLESGVPEIQRMVSPDNLFAAAVVYAEARGFSDGDMFVTDPATLPPLPPPEPDPATLALQAQTQIEQFKQWRELKEAEWKHEEKVWELRIKAAEAGVAIEVPIDDPELGSGAPTPVVPPVPQPPLGAAQ